MAKNEKEKQKPVFKANSGALQCSVWKNVNKDKKGKKFETLSMTIVRTYKDVEDEWQTTNNMRIPRDLINLETLIHTVRTEFCLKMPTDTETEETEDADSDEDEE